ncbi:hypothetical protein CGCSCA4_v001071 [Colletotrichum siamense]|uniref:Uncharacterized protein n=1 Tax=Colletotrichum siamense TaxID=690259 RepID=A0A9P5F3U6_COLSI|nr:hypothetical protein CGCSCA4_v001071 [Colletotrichum siamense]KAF4866177.1 hypothetical protein CGCSCA2_v001174 [Colletotrichum siamense]
MMETTWMPRKPRILAISLLHHEIHDEYWRPFHREAAHHVTLQVATEPETAIQVLQQSTPPKVVLITDGGLARPENGHVWYSVLAYVHQGGTAIAMGFFSYALVEVEVNSFFLLAGLNWRARACPQGLSAMLNRDADQVGSTGLPNDFICCQSFYLTEVGFHEAWYVGQPECKSLKNGEMFFGPCCKGISVGVPAAFGKIGKGRLGYVGGHDPACGSGDTVWAMCGLPPLYRKFFRKPMVAWSE